MKKRNRKFLRTTVFMLVLIALSVGFVFAVSTENDFSYSNISEVDKGEHPYDLDEYSHQKEAARVVMDDLGCTSTGIEFFNNIVGSENYVEFNTLGYIMHYKEIKYDRSYFPEKFASVKNTVYLYENMDSNNFARIAAHECLHLRQFELYGDKYDIKKELTAAYRDTGNYSNKEDYMEQQVDCATVLLGYPVWQNAYTRNCADERGHKAKELIDFARNSELEVEGDYFDAGEWKRSMAENIQRMIYWYN